MIADHDKRPDYSPHPCAKCGAVVVRVSLEDERYTWGTYYAITCESCGHYYESDGPDA